MSSRGSIEFMPCRPPGIMSVPELAAVAHEAAKYEALADDASRSWATRQNASARAAELRRRLRQDALDREVMRHRAQRSEREVRQQAPQAQRQSYMPTRPTAEGADVARLRGMVGMSGETWAERWSRAFEAVRGEVAFVAS